MPSSLMLNFRVKAEFGAALDKACKASGMSRSDFIRTALQQAVTRTNGSPAPDPRVDSGPRSLRKPKMSGTTTAMSAPKDQCEHPKSLLKSTPYGVKICQGCGAKIG